MSDTEYERPDVWTPGHITHGPDHTGHADHGDREGADR